MWFRETEAKLRETVSVSLRNETFFKAKLGHPNGQLRIWIQEVKKPRKYTGSLGEYRNGNIKLK